MPRKRARSQHAKPAVKMRDMEAKTTPKGGKKSSGRHHHDISISKTLDKTSPILFGP